VILILVCLYLYWSSRPRIEKFRLSLLVIFGDTSWHRTSGRMHSLLCGLLVCHLGVWLSWYKISVILCLVPLIMIEIEKFTSQGSDMKALRNIRVFLMWISELQLLYLAWFSWFSFFFLAFFFYPKLTAIIVSGILFVISIFLQGFAVAQTTFFDKCSIKSGGLIWYLVYFLSFFLFYFSISSYWTFIPHLLVTLFLAPATFIAYVILALRFVSTLLSTKGLTGTLFLTFFVLFTLGLYGFQLVTKLCGKRRKETEGDTAFTEEEPT